MIYDLFSNVSTSATRVLAVVYETGIGKQGIKRIFWGILKTTTLDVYERSSQQCCHCCLFCRVIELLSRKIRSDFDIFEKFISLSVYFRFSLILRRAKSFLIFLWSQAEVLPCVNLEMIASY